MFRHHNCSSVPSRLTLPLGTYRDDSILNNYPIQDNGLLPIQWKMQTITDHRYALVPRPFCFAQVATSARTDYRQNKISLVSLMVLQ